MGLMLSAILNSPRAVQVSILIVRAFVRLRELLATHPDLALEIEDLNRKVDVHSKEITAIIDTIERLLLPEPVPPRSRIGFDQGGEEAY
jgi:hypothetical protein